MTLFSSRILFSASRYVRWVLIIALTVSAVVIITTERMNMTNKYDINIFSKEKLDFEESSTDFYNYILIFAIAISLIATTLLIFHNGRTSKLKSLQIAQLENSQASSNLKIAEANQRAEEAIAEGKKYIALSDSLKVELQKLKNNFLARTLPTDKIGLIKERLHALRGNKITIMWPMGNFESYNFAQQIVALFRLCEWEVNISDEYLDLKKPISGLDIMDDGKSTIARQHAIDIFSWFTEIGIPIRRSVNIKMDVELCLYVGSKELITK